MPRCRLATHGHALLSLMLAAAACGACSDGRSATAPASKVDSKPPAATSLPAVSSASAPAVPRGEALYARMCSVCHGAAGEGYKADNAPALGHPDYIGTVSDGLLRAAILEGRRGTTMSAWGQERGGPLSTRDADDLIAFMRTWEKGRPRPALDERPLEGEAVQGRPIFERECVRCHGPGGLGGPNTQLADLKLLENASNGFLRHAIARGRSGTPMPAYATTLSAQDINHVIQFMRDAAVELAKELAAEATSKPAPLRLGPVPLNPKGKAPVGFTRHPGTTKADLVHLQLSQGARMAILDARTPSDYQLDHIAGAVSVPFYEPEPYFAKLPKDAWLVCYCGCPHAESKALAQKLMDHGFRDVTVLDEGLGFWKMKGYPTRAGATP
jgi:cytochrome c oxidase cbb3-type subunit 3